MHIQNLCKTLWKMWKNQRRQNSFYVFVKCFRQSFTKKTAKFILIILYRMHKNHFCSKFSLTGATAVLHGQIAQGLIYRGSVSPGMSLCSDGRRRIHICCSEGKIINGRSEGLPFVSFLFNSLKRFKLFLCNSDLSILDEFD